MSIQTFPPPYSFAQVLELVEQLALDERQSLLNVVSRRIAAEERQRIAQSVKSARRQHREKKTRPVTPKQLMRRY